jgi:hypothetical protein
MDNEIEPSVGSWYQDLINGRIFQVVALDEDEAQVDLQHSDGDIEELSLDEWHSMDLEAVDAPDDWTGPLDDAERNNLEFASTRSEGEARGRAQSRRSASLQSPDETDEGIVETQPIEEAGVSDVMEGTAREARDRSRSRP